MFVGCLIVLSSFAIILMGMRELVALLCLSSWCLCGCFVDLPHGAMVGLYLKIVVSPGDIHLPLWEQLSE